MEKEKARKMKEPENFTPGLAAFDALPVLFFGGTVVLLGTLLKSPLFITGAALSFLGGFLKVLWKGIVACRKKNIAWMSKQMRFTMPAGFVCMITGFLMHRKDPALSGILFRVVRMPVLPFLLVGILGFVLMGIFAAKLDSSRAKNNWIEQITNAIGQLSLLIGTILLTL